MKVLGTLYLSKNQSINQSAWKQLEGIVQEPDVLGSLTGQGASGYYLLIL